MITLSLLKFIENHGLGKIDEDLFFQKLALGKVGVYISDIGEAIERGARKRQSFEIFARGNNDIDGYKRLKAVVDLLNDSYGVCVLPAVPPVTNEPYENVTIMPLSSISNVGLDDDGRVIYSATGTIYY